MSQDITAAVQGGFLPVSVAAAPTLTIVPVEAAPSLIMTINAIINQQASL